MPKPGSAGSSPRASGSRTAADDLHTKLKAAIEGGQRQRQAALELATTALTTLSDVLAALSGSEQKNKELELALEAAQQNGHSPTKEFAMSDEDSISIKENNKGAWILLMIMVFATVLLGNFIPFWPGEMGQFGKIAFAVFGGYLIWKLFSWLVEVVEAGKSQFHFWTKQSEEAAQLLNNEQFKKLGMTQPATSRFRPFFQEPVAKDQDTSRLQELLEAQEDKAGELANAKALVTKSNETLQNLRLEEQRLTAELPTLSDPEKAVAEARIKELNNELAADNSIIKEGLIAKQATDKGKRQESQKQAQKALNQAVKDTKAEVERLYQGAGSALMIRFSSDQAKTLRWVALVCLLYLGLSVPTMLVDTLYARKLDSAAWLCQKLVAPKSDRVRVERKQLKVENNDPRRVHANDQGEVTLITLHMSGETASHVVVDIKKTDEEKSK